MLEYLKFAIVLFALGLVCGSWSGCKEQNMALQKTDKFQSEEESMEYEHTNALINESSPYLLQHAHNPVNWHPWGDAALEKAKRENKMLIVSIGYSSCHWCHVMEHESFEDSIVASIMNDNFVCIKVDREERPDIDQIYMDACQLVTGRGGWPLNAFALPDGRPVHAGTYYPRTKWIDLLQQLANMYQREPEKVLEYARNLEAGIVNINKLEKQEGKLSFSKDDLKQSYESIKHRYDNKWGGFGGAPKFPMPSTYDFLLYYGSATENTEALKMLHHSMRRIAQGGIYDHLGGGFARYSTDEKWKVPHFEKMLYDNGQLLELYSKAWRQEKNEIYRDVVYETIAWLEREMISADGAFYSALDADSEGEEGKFYVWKSSEIKEILNEQEYELLSGIYDIDGKSLWEHGNNVLMIHNSPIKDDPNYLKNRNALGEAKEKLFKVRAKRIRPGLDDKTVLSWNALTISGLAEAYRTFGEKSFLDLAEKNVDFIYEKMISDGKLLRTYKEGNAKINAFMEDYSLLIKALIDLYQATYNEDYLLKAKDMTAKSFTLFKDPNSDLFFFKAVSDGTLVTKKYELSDNVIPSPNSIMATNLFKLGHVFGNTEWIEQSKRMIASVSDNLLKNGSYYAAWAELLSMQSLTYYEIVVAGKNADELVRKLDKKYIPNAIILSSAKDSQLEIFEGRFSEGQTLIYVCQDQACQLPVSEIEEALNQMSKNN